MTSKNMTKKKTNNPELSAEQIKEQQETQACADEIAEVLQKRNRGLQPYLVASEFGIVPRVRLAIVEKESDEETK